MKEQIYKFGNIGIAIVWIVNGLFCKLLNGVPRHGQIVARILGPTYASPLTHMIGFLEVLMAVWVLSGIKSRWCTLSQMVLVGVMNILEFFIARELLLFGPLNIVFAAIFIILLYIHGHWLSVEK
ncbi:DoxX-like protein [Chitinophaga polysaccharea]|uniref:DoxX-like protein n=1 Tax=Chitinophaga polysaccharea TaxID=1293035 RepID=A0A561PM51_9BACT|nr:DoxX-like family protein [Chitinophaga polysaccharea]TWF39197.1 DoxX-like protein [Chitinophaga polysaccharea]